MNRRSFFKVSALSVASLFAVLTTSGKAAFRVSSSTIVEAQSIGRKLITDKEVSFAKLDSFLTSFRPNETMGILFEIFKGSIEQMNADKEYFLSKLKHFNEVGQALADYLSELNEVSSKGGKCTPLSAVNTAYEIERKLSRVINQIKVLPKRDRASPDIQALLDALVRQRKIVLKAQSEYQRLM